MQNLALLLLLAITASTIFAFDGAVFAQESEAPEAEITEEEVTEETEGEVMEDDAVGDDVTEEEVMEDEMETTMMEEVASPRQQLVSGTDPHEIQCADGMQLVFKASNFHPACVKESSYQVLLQRGWVSDHDPSHEELSGLIAGLPVPEETTEETPDEETEDEEIVMEEDIEMEEDSTMGNGTEITPQSHTIELSESMEMGAN
ncbi:hypothetical protein [Candidatus Nitrosotenuis cloacae]|uniref:Uncharacterized protein n=1 Tax=Candidatus Nitrosotenuis cloacae TaxID=1603555 RepID=A0A3G1B058_9ARCH|nr:hypothetical protein [Candidatus Nitrosotenuis cloacae]AJZ75511.1 hypothetical protein SU86_002985 [Candidatus Nitrosotenuis cloacae]